MDIQLIIYFILVLFAAFFIYSFVGFGAGLVAIPLLLIVLPAKTVIPVTLAITLINGLFLVRQGWGHVQWKHVLRLLLGGLVGVPIGVSCLKFLPSQVIVLSVNICIFIFACLYLSKVKPKLKHEHPIIESATGLASGILSGGCGVGGPPIVMYGILRGWQKDAFRSTMLIYFVGLGVWSNLSLVLFKMHSTETIRLILIMVIPSLFASWLGVRLKKKASEDVFQRVVLIVIVVTSLIGIVRQLV